MEHYSLYVGIGLLFFVILCAIICDEFIHLRKKNRLLCEIFKNNDSLKVKLETCQANTKDAKDEDSVLFSQLQYFVCQQYVFSDSNFSQTKLSELVSSDLATIGRIFWDKTGQSFIDYINEQRLNYAFQQMMEYRRFKVNDVSKMVGFSSKSTFCQLFNAHFGLSPFELRYL